jgi:PAS domain S-box-containing protein
MTVIPVLSANDHVLVGAPICALLVLTLVTPGAVAQGAVETPHTIRVVMDNAYAPFAFQSYEGKLQGILIDQWQAWEKKTGIRVEIHALDWGEALRRMRAGEFDVIDCIVETPERRDYFDFTPAYTAIEASIFFRNEISGITDLASLKGFPVGVKVGDQHSDQLKANGVTTMIPFENNDAIIGAAKQHKINVFVVDDPSALYLLNKAGIEGEFRHSAPMFHDELRRAVRKGNAGLLREVSDGFAAIEPAELKQINEKWFGRTINWIGRYLTYAGYAVAATFVIIAGLAVWNRALRTKVLQRTAALSESEQRFRRLVELMPVAVYVCDTSGIIQSYNNRAVELWGRKPKSGDTAQRYCASLRLYSPEGKLVPHQESQMAEVLRTGVPAHDAEVVIERPDGSCITALVNIAPLRNGKGELIGAMNCFQDITERKRAEEAVKHAEDRIRLIIETIPTMAWSIRRDGVLDFLNQRWLDYTGLSLEEAIEEPTRAVHPKDLSRVMEKWLVVKDTSEAYEDEMRLRRADGEYRWFLVRIAPLLDEQGNIIKRYGVSIDIEDRKQAELALDERLRFETLLTELSAAFANLPTTAVDREIDKWLQNLVRFLDVDRAAFDQVREDGMTLLRSHSHTAHGIDAQPLNVAIDQTPWITKQLLQGKTVKWSRIPDEIPEQASKEKEFAGRIGAKSVLSIPVCIGGAVICAVSFTSMRISRDWPDEMVARLRLVGEIFANAIARKRAEEALFRREAELNEAQRLASIGSWEWDIPAGGRTYSDELHNIYGFEGEGRSLPESAFSEAVHPDDRARRRVAIEAALNGGPSYEAEFRIIRPDKSVRFVHSRGRLIYDEAGQPVRMLGMVQDITERKRAARELEEANHRLRILSRRLFEVQEEERRHLARELHDEIGQALTAAKINLQSVTGNGGGVTFARLQETTGILDRLLGQVRQISLDLRPSMLDDLGLVPALRSLLDQQGRRASVAVRLSAENIPEKLGPEIQTTCFRIAQEAITNALRHAGATQIEIDLRRENGELRLLVCDNGLGFDVESAQAQPVGLGLIGVKERAALVGGRARIISSPNKGTTIEVSVPLAWSEGQDRHGRG